MVYPSHYSPGWLGLEDPSKHPGAVVAYALNRALERIGDSATLRPWLQAWELPPADIGKQISEAEARGLGWMLWNGRSRYDKSALPN